MSGLHYLGKGAWVKDIPARDLTAQEVDQYGGTEALLKTGLYELSTPDNRRFDVPAVPSETDSKNKRSLKKEGDS